MTIMEQQLREIAKASISFGYINALDAIIKSEFAKRSLELSPVYVSKAKEYALEIYEGNWRN